MTMTMARTMNFHGVVITRDPPQPSERMTHDADDRSKLPSIRQMLPEFGLGVKPSLVSSASSSTTSPSISDAGVRSPPDYVYSPNPSKRRRVSVGEEDDERASPRRQRYTPPWTETPNQAPRQLSVDTVPRSATDSWTGPSPVSSQNGSLPPIWSAVAMDAAEANERAHAQTSVSSPTRRPLTDTYPRERSRGFTFPDYSQRAGMEHTSAPPAPYQPGGYYLSHRAPSLSVPPAHYGRSGYDSAHHYRRNSYDTVQHYPDYMHMSEHAEMGSNGLNKPPKKRGNLPKDTTDKLLAWFHAHLDHPYPTEEEKHKLMRQTGLQMNQISNWFINIRRRKWPEVRRERQAAATASSRPTDASGVERVEYETSERRRSAASA